jgi:hypothetical protein
MGELLQKLLLLLLQLMPLLLILTMQRHQPGLQGRA